MRMQEGLLSQGRQGIRTAAYGGTPEQLAFEQARQEAMLNAQLAARTQFGTEQDRLLTQAQGLQTAGYNPQRQAIDLFGAAATPADIAGAGRRQGASIYGTSAIQGLEGMMQGEQLANELRQQQIQAMLGGVTGSRDPVTGQLSGGLFGQALDFFGGNNVIDQFAGNIFTQTDNQGNVIGGFNEAPQEYLDTLDPNSPNYIPPDESIFL